MTKQAEADVVAVAAVAVVPEGGARGDTVLVVAAGVVSEPNEAP